VQEALTAAAGYPTGEVSWTGPLACARAEAAYLQGHPDRIDALTARDLDRARAAGLGWLAGDLACWRSRARVGGDGDAGGLAEPHRLELAGRNREAAAAWDALGSPYEAGLALSTSAEETDLAEAHARLSALGARPAAALAARRLRELGVRGVARGPRPKTRANPANLTVRETEVLGLLAEGLTNVEIAGRLFVSRRTVDHHVAAILRKLEAPSRSRAVVAAGRLGITEPAAGTR
jgi:DNA-binding CsgD family transcriptional regulator